MEKDTKIQLTKKQNGLEQSKYEKSSIFPCSYTKEKQTKLRAHCSDCTTRSAACQLSTLHPLKIIIILPFTIKKDTANDKLSKLFNEGFLHTKSLKYSTKFKLNYSE